MPENNEILNEGQNLIIEEILQALSDEEKKELIKKLTSQVISKEGVPDKKSSVSTDWYDGFQSLFEEKKPVIKLEVVEPPQPTHTGDSYTPISEPEIEQTTVEVEITPSTTTTTTEPIITTTTTTLSFNYEKPDGWNKKKKNTSLLIVLKNGILGKGMEPGDQRRYDDIKGNFTIVVIISLILYLCVVTYRFNQKDNTNSANPSLVDKVINFVVEKYDRLTGYKKNEYTDVSPKDTNTVVSPKIDTSTLLIIKDTVSIIKKDKDTTIIKPVEKIKPIPEIKEPKKETPTPQPKPQQKNTKENLIIFIKTLPEYSKFGVKDAPYLTQMVDKTEWAFLRADGKTVYFKFDNTTQTFSVKN